MATPKKQPPKPAAPKTPSRSTRTRKDVKDDFDDLVEEQDDTPADPKTQALAKARATQVKSKTQGVTPETIVNQLAEVGLGIQKTLSDVQAQLLAELNQLAELREAADIERAEIGTLHNIDVALAATDVLIQEHFEKQQALEQEFATKAKALDEAHAQRTAEEARQADDTQAAHERDEADYAYRTKLARRKAEDEFAQKQQLQERQLAEKKEALEKAWSEREAKLQASEKELVDLRAAATAIPEQIKKEKDAAVAIATNSLKKDLTAEFNLAKKDLEQQIALARQQAQALAAQNDTYAKRVSQLEGDVAAARSEVKDMALASFREAGASKALAEVTSMASRDSNSSGSRSKS